ncbi:MAG: YrbL family protein [Hyphomicrobium sp.]
MVAMTPITLSDKSPIASGSIRDVYQHPSDPRLLIKVVRLSMIDEKYGSGRPWYKIGKRRYHHLISYLREIREHLAQHARGEGHPQILQNVVGVLQTDLGLGLVVEAAVDRDGRCAPTLTKVIETGRFDRNACAHLDRFFDDLIKSTIIVADAHPGNIVYAYTPERGDHFVLIDGIGFKTLIPLERFSKTINRLSNRYKVRALRAKVEKLVSARSPRAAKSVDGENPTCASAAE